MDDSGRMYASPAALREMCGKEADVEPESEMPPGTLLIADPKVAAMLAGMPRRARRAFMSERRRGVSEDDALGAAEAVLND
jgi:hypothetical protein